MPDFSAKLHEAVDPVERPLAVAALHTAPGKFEDSNDTDAVGLHQPEVFRPRRVLPILWLVSNRDVLQHCAPFRYLKINSPQLRGSIWSSKTASSTMPVC